MFGAEPETIGFYQNHLHTVMVILPEYSIAEIIIGQLKSQWASSLRKKFKWLCKVYWKQSIVWPPDGFVSSVGINEEVIRNYVLHQGKQD